MIKKIIYTAGCDTLMEKKLFLFKKKRKQKSDFSDYFNY